MAIEILLPKLGLTMEEGTVDEWLVADGSAVTMGMPLLRLATDKIDVDVEAEGEGILARAVPDGTTLARAPCSAGCSSPARQLPRVRRRRRLRLPRPPTRSSSSRRCRATDDLEVASAGGRVFISPNARRVAHELDVDLASVTGTGPGGRIVSEDVEEAAAQGAQAPARASPGGSSRRSPDVTPAMPASTRPPSPPATVSSGAVTCGQRRHRRRRRAPQQRSRPPPRRSSCPSARRRHRSSR